MIEAAKTFFIKTLKGIFRVLKRFIPAGVIGFYEQYRKVYPLIDRSEVVSFTSTSAVLSDKMRLLPTSDLPPPGVKCSLISTVRNEAGSAAAWMASLLEQSRWPDEVVITDGGSNDATLEILRGLAQSFPIPLRIIETAGANISRGRNLAIQHAVHEIIASTDFGCSLDINWLRNLLAPFELDQSIEVSAGYYQIAGKSLFHRLSARLYGVRPEVADPQGFLPSSRSLAFKKTFYEKTGGYPEWLSDAGEDTLFDYFAKSHPSRWAFVPDALVYWNPPDSLLKLIRSYFRYSRGDGEAGTSAELYWYKTVELFWVNFVRLVVIGIGLMLFWISGPWAWYYWLGILLIVLFRFIRANLEASTQLGVFFFPYTIILEIVGIVQVIGYAVGVGNRAQLAKRKKAVHLRKFESILEEHPDVKGIILYPPTHDWHFMAQRPHQLARAFAKKGYLYFYCTHNERTDAVDGFQQLDPRLYLTHVDFDIFGGLDQPIVYIGSPWNVSYLSIFRDPLIIYDHYDDLVVSGGRQEDHLELLKQADIVLVTSQILLDNVQQVRPDCILVPNGVDYEFINASKPGNEAGIPLDLASALQPNQPIVGYSGALAEWFDFELVASLARSKPEWIFILIGVNYDGSLTHSGILDIPNIHWLGMKSYDHLFQYIWSFDVAIIPFKVNSITLATSPIKLFEYMACKKPVVSVSLPECRRYPGVFLADSQVQFQEMLARALEVKNQPDYLSLIDKVARENTWRNRVERIEARLEKRIT